LLGVIDFDNCKAQLFNSFRVKFSTISELIIQPIEVLSTEDGMEVIMEKFEASSADVLPIFQNDKYIGFVSKLDLLKAYRKRLKEMTID